MDQGDDYSPFQLIDENGILNDAGIQTFVDEVKLAECGLSYATLSIMGPQSSGKSTLLNHLFGTNFREMDALKERCQTTKGIWLAKCPGIETSTLIIDLEGTDGKERGEDDTTFEKQAALFALAVSDIVLINMWCHDVGRVQAANRPLLGTVFQVMRQVFTSRKTTLLFVLRDKTKTPIEILEPLLRKDIQQIWNSFAKPDANNEIPLSEFFNVEIVALASYEEKEEQFKEQVANLRQHLFNSIILGGLAGDGRDVVPASEFSFSAQQIWNIIKENKDLDLPAHKVMVATVRCEEIANRKLTSFIENEDWCQIDKDVKLHPVPNFGKKLNLILDTCLLEYDAEARFFDEGVKTEKRNQLKDALLQLLEPAYQSMLEHIRSGAFNKFKEQFNKDVMGGKEFSVAAHDCSKSFMTQLDEGCTDAIIEQANWDSSKLSDMLQHDIDEHVAAVRSSKLFELLTRYEIQLEAVLAEPVETLLVRAREDTWQEIRELFWLEVNLSINKFSTALYGFSMDEQSNHKQLEKLKDYARGVIQVKAKQEAGKVLTHMKERFERFFSHDSNSKLRVWSGKEDVEAIRETARSASLKLLSILAAIRLNDDADDIEKTLILSLVANNESTKLFDPLDSNTWEKVPSSETLITPKHCKRLWEEFNEYSEHIVNQAQEACVGAGNFWSRASQSMSPSFISGAVTGAAVGLVTGAAAVGTVGSAATVEATRRVLGPVAKEVVTILVAYLKSLSHHRH